MLTLAMRVLLFVEPLVMHSRPFHYWAWLGYFARMLEAIEASGGEARIVVNEALAMRATAPRDEAATGPERGHGLPIDRVVTLEQEAIRRLFSCSNIDILTGLHRGSFTSGDREAYGALVREALGEFVPDVMLALTPAAQLSAAFPDALLMYTETAAYSRAPYPSCLFFDPCGLWDASLLAVHVEALRAAVATPEERELLASFRERFARYFALTSPFAALERDLRTRFRRIGLLPLQFGGESGFDTNAPFRTQGEYLLHVLENLPGSVGLIVVEHPTAHWVGDIIDDETRAFVSARWPNVMFVNFRDADSAGQLLVHHVDFVISVSSSIALQALLFGRPIVSVGTSHLTGLASVRGMESFPADGVFAFDPQLDNALAWLLTRYFVTVDRATDPTWLSGFLERTVERARRGVVGPALFDVIAPLAETRDALFATLDGLTAARLTGILDNGDFTRWSAGRPAAWELVDLGATDARLRRGASTATGATVPRGASATVPPSASQASESTPSSSLILKRSFAGSGPTLLLQRVPDVRACAGVLARIRFSGRAAKRTPIAVYIYLQIDDAMPGEGTAVRVFELDDTWQTYECVVRAPAIGARRPGPGSHTEIVFALLPDAGAAEITLAAVSLEAVAV